ncbi:MAG TPA: DUF4340 domain-containing protein [Phycisphaerales bacterium]|nr:DUF4340 domain-containing protein [Phycisphaerales bacterium]
MSTRPAIIALLVTLLLAVAAYLVLKRPSGAAGAPAVIAQGERVVSFDAASLKAITLRVPPGRPQVIDHNPDGRWYWRSSPRASRQFALDDARTGTLLRLFNEAKGVSTPPTDRPLPDAPAPVTLTLHGPDGDTIIRFAPRALGGQVMADVSTPRVPTPRPAVVSDELLNVLTSPGPSAWRDTRAVGADPGTAARIAFTDGPGKTGFGLARREGHWMVTPPAPVTAPAEDEPVRLVLNTIAALSITRFYDDATQPTPQAAGLDKPTAVLTLEFDDHAVSPADQRPATTTRTIRLLFGQPADTEGTALYATPDDGVTVFAVNAVALSRLTAPASNLVMRAPTRTPPADVGSMEFSAAAPASRTLVIARDGVTGRWSESVDKAEPVTLDTGSAAAAASVLQFLTRGGADAVSFEAPQDAKPLLSVTLRSPGGSPLDQFEVLSAGNGLVIKSGGVYRTYGKPPQPLLAWIARLQR